MFFRVLVLREVGGFDERFFMYLEDYDLTRRVHKVARTVLYPEVSVFHGFKKESYSNLQTLKYHIRSAIKYFNKWGWFIDREREMFNKKVIKETKT
jgi:GT2 family glycosyltransferase